MFILALIISVIVPLIVILCGYLLRDHTPKEINGTIGYRTKRSKSSPEAWLFANKLCGDMWIKGGLVSLLPSLILVLIICRLFGSNTGVGAATAVELVQVGLMFLPVYFVERQLKEKFEDHDKQNEE